MYFYVCIYVGKRVVIPFFKYFGSLFRRRSILNKTTKKTPTKETKKISYRVLQGINLGQPYFLCAHHDNYEEMRDWMIKSWNSSL